MRSHILSLSLVLAFPVFAQNEVPPAVSQAVDEFITLEIGEERVLIIPEVTRVAIGDPQIADVKMVDKAQLLLEGVGPGTTTLLLWKRDGSRRVIEVTVR